MYFLLIGFTRQVITMFLIYLAYLLLGSFSFVMLETEHELETRNKSMETVYLTRALVGSLRQKNFSDEDIYLAFLEQNEKQIHEVRTESLGWKQLYGDKVFFAFILITTVGYGNISPTTVLGQIVCIIYSLLGIPLHVIMMRLLSFKFRGGLRKLFKLTEQMSPSKIFLFVTGFFFFLICAILFVLIPSYVFTVSENWTYSRGVYFSFVSLTTIGLGDYVAGVSAEHYDDTYYSLDVVLMLLWMFFGLGFIAMALNMLSYFMGVALMETLDSKCHKRAIAKRKTKALLNLVKEVNWQLVKYKPEDFQYWGKIEDFKNLLIENPQDVTVELLREMFDIAIDLKEKAYEQLSGLQQTKIPLTPVIAQARDDLPEVLSRESTVVSFRPSTSVTKEEPPVTDSTGKSAAKTSDLEDVAKAKSLTAAASTSSRDYIISSKSSVILSPDSEAHKKRPTDAKRASDSKCVILSTEKVSRSDKTGKSKSSVLEVIKRGKSKSLQDSSLVPDSKKGKDKTVDSKENTEDSDTARETKDADKDLKEDKF